MFNRHHCCRGDVGDGATFAMNQQAAVGLLQRIAGQHAPARKSDEKT